MEDFELQPSEENVQPKHTDGPKAPKVEHAGPAPHQFNQSKEDAAPREKVDFENLPEFVKQRQMLKNVKIAAAVVTAVVLLIGILVVKKMLKSTVTPIVDELKKEDTGIEQLKDLNKP